MELGAALNILTGRRFSSVVEHLSANPKVRFWFDSGPGLMPGSWIMMRHVSCILLLEWSTTSQRLWVYRISVLMHKQIPDSYSKREGDNPGNSGLSSQQ